MRPRFGRATDPNRWIPARRNPPATATFDEHQTRHSLSPRQSSGVAAAGSTTTWPGAQHRPAAYGTRHTSRHRCGPHGAATTAGAAGHAPNRHPSTKQTNGQLAASATRLAAAASRGTGRGTSLNPRTRRSRRSGSVGRLHRGLTRWAATPGARVQLDGADLPSQRGHRERLADPGRTCSARDELAVGHAVGSIGQLECD